MPLDLYAALGVPKTADQAEIKRAFRTLAQKYHPDRNKEPGAETRFKEISAAHEVLGDEQRRALYDEFGEDSLRSGFDAEQARAWKARGGMPPPGAGGFGGGVNIDDILRGFGGGGFGNGGGFGGFGGGFSGGGRRPSRGADIEGDVQVPLLDALQGKPLSVSILRPVNCRTCDGKGGKGAKSCATCSGSGRRQVRAMGSMMAVACNDCGGSGEVFEDECDVCGGTGRVRERQNVQVSLPVGIGDGKVMRLRGQGAEGQDRAPAGDLLLTVHIVEHPLVRRKDDDLEMDLPVSLTEAIGGGPVDIPLPTGGKIRFPLPAGTGNGQRLRVRGKGVDGGDLYLVVRPVLPKLETAERPDALELARKLDAGKDPRAGWTIA